MVRHDPRYPRVHRRSACTRAQIMFTIDLAKEPEGSGVSVYALHPATWMDTHVVRARRRRAAQHGRRGRRCGHAPCHLVRPRERPVLHRPRGVALLAGQFDVSDPLFKRELRLEFEDYQIYRVRVGDTGADLTYDRGLMALVSPWKGGDVAIQVLNGRGLSAAGENRQYDRDPWKNVALRYSHEFGPLRLGGSAPRSSTACATGSRSGLPTSP